MTAPTPQPRHPLALLADYLEQVQRLDAVDEAGLPITPEIMAPLVEAHSVVLSLDPAALRAQAEAGLREASTALLDEYWKNYGRPDSEFIATRTSGATGRQHISQTWINLRAALAQAGGDEQ